MRRLCRAAVKGLIRSNVTIFSHILPLFLRCGMCLTVPGDQHLLTAHCLVQNLTIYTITNIMYYGELDKHPAVWAGSNILILSLLWLLDTALHFCVLSEGATGEDATTLTTDWVRDPLFCVFCLFALLPALRADFRRSSFMAALLRGLSYCIKKKTEYTSILFSINTYLSNQSNRLTWTWKLSVP